MKVKRLVMTTPAWKEPIPPMPMRSWKSLPVPRW